MLGTATALASRIHENQKDKGGKPYILHPLRIMMRLRTRDEELMSIAVLHDVVEDSTVTLQQLTDMGFSKRVTDALALLTHDHDVGYEAYIRQISMSRDASLVKLEDLRDNSDITRLKGIREKDMQRAAKYNRAFLFLSGVLDTADKVWY